MKKIKIKKKIWIPLLVVIILVAAVSIINANAKKLVNGYPYRTEAAAYQDIVVTVSGSGAVEPADSYTVMALVTGDVLSAPFEEGDVVSKEDLLYEIDSGDMENEIQRAQIAVEQAQLSYNSSLSSATVSANAAGVVRKLYVKAGDTVSPGASVAEIIDAATLTIQLPFHSADAKNISVGQSATVTVEGTMERLTGTVEAVAAADEVAAGNALVRRVTIRVTNPGALTSAASGTAVIQGIACQSSASFEENASYTVYAEMSGEIAALSVREGSRVAAGQQLVSLGGTSLTSTLENARLGLEAAKLSLKSAEDALENYHITSPIAGTVIEKKYKTGDTLETVGSNYLAVIYDLSYLKFTLNVDELDIRKVSVGQNVAITADAVEGESFSGRVNKVNINGTTINGVTSYPVEILIEKAGNLLPGMNVSADILVENARQVLAIPLDAVSRGNVVKVAPAGAIDAKSGSVDTAKLEERTVELGRSDTQYIEVLSGLAEGEIVVMENSASDLMSSMMTMRQTGAPAI